MRPPGLETQLSLWSVGLACMNPWFYYLVFYTLNVVAQICEPVLWRGKQEDQKFMFNLDHIVNWRSWRLAWDKKDPDLNSAILSLSEDPILIVQKKPEASNQTNGSLQGTFVRKAGQKGVLYTSASMASFFVCVLFIFFWGHLPEQRVGMERWEDKWNGVHGMKFTKKQ